MKNTKLASKWSRERFGDICKQLITREDIVKTKADLFEAHLNANNRMVLQRAQVELK